MFFLSFLGSGVSNPARPRKLETAQDQAVAAPAVVPAIELSDNDSTKRRAFEPEAALARVEGNHELLRPMIGVVAKQWLQLGAEIASAARRRDGAALELSANRLQRSVGSFGARQASRVTQDLQTLGRSHDFQNVGATCTRLTIEIKRLVNDLEDFAKGIAPVGARLA